MSRILAPLFELSNEKNDLSRMLAEWLVLHREKAEEPHCCPCGKDGIKELCYIRHIPTGRRYAIGNCCISIFKTSALCDTCKLYPILSDTSHKCQFCAHHRKDAPTGVVLKGKPLYGAPILGLPYAEAYKANPAYAKYILATPQTEKYNDPHYLAYLRLIQSRVEAKARLVAGGY